MKQVAAALRISRRELSRLCSRTPSVMRKTLLPFSPAVILVEPMPAGLYGPWNDEHTTGYVVNVAVARRAIRGRNDFMSYLDELFSVAGKTALVTGAATGIGRMAATGLIQAGANVMIASRKGADCEKTAEELNALGAAGKAEGFAGDVSSEEGVLALAEEVKKRTDKLHILI